MKKLLNKYICHEERCVKTSFKFYSSKDASVNKKVLIDFRLIKFNSGHYFNFNFLCKEYYTNEQWKTTASFL